MNIFAAPCLRYFFSSLIILFLISACDESGQSSSNSTPRTLSEELFVDKDGNPLDEASLPYALVNGCYSIQSVPDGKFIVASDNDLYEATQSQQNLSESFYFQTTELGHYLLIDKTGKALSSQESGNNSYITRTDSFTKSSIWKANVKNRLFSFQSKANGRPLTINSENGRVRLASGNTDPSAELFRLLPAENCTSYPEAQVNATGKIDVARSNNQHVWGIADTHIHITAYEFIGGRVNYGAPFHQFGLPHALDDCAEVHGPNGTLNFLESIVSFSPLFRTHSTTGYPSFKDWPAPNALTHHQTYYKWIERAYKGGVRLLVNQLVANELLCEIYPLKIYPCNEMLSIDLQLQRIHEMESYIDAQSGGPGKGWFRIADTPTKAREIIRQGKLAVLLGIESSILFDCHAKPNVSSCTKEHIDKSLAKYYSLGVRALFPTHEFNNALGGTGLFDVSDIAGNLGNKLTTGQYLTVEQCEDPEHTHKQMSLFPTANESPLKEILSFFGKIAAPTLPSYDQSLSSHCNAQGITELGEYLVQRMMDKGMLIELDHMSEKMRNRVLTLAEARSYSGVISSHSGSGGLTTTQQIIRIRDLGGLVSPILKTAQMHIDNLRRLTGIMTQGQYLVGIGVGTDVNGFNNLPVVRADNANNSVRYPFTSYDGDFILDKQKTAERVFDINIDGVSHYGLLPDFIEDMRRMGLSDTELEPMFQSAEAYLQMWERASVSATE